MALHNPASSHPRTVRILAALLLVLALLVQARPSAASPRPDTALDIIALVNALRAQYGLEPYQIDGDVMAFAQAHSEYQASIHLATHQHSDGTVSQAHGMRENIATGTLGFMTPEFAVYTVWSDAIHMDPMVGYSSGYVGAGVASDGTEVYYTLNVRPGSGKIGSGGSGSSKRGTGTPVAVIPLVPLVTVTPRMDGWNVHTVGYGQTLWAIANAYSVPADMIRAWNSMEAGSNEIYAGQKLIIRAPTGTVATLQFQATAAAAVTATNTVVNPTATATLNPDADLTQSAPRSARTQIAAVYLLTELPTATPARPTETPTPTGFALASSGPLAAGLLILFGGTLLVVLAFGLVKKK